MRSGRRHCLPTSGDATPSMAPVPSSRLYRETFFSRAYALNEASSAPPPGRMPSADPRAVPRRMGAHMRLKSSFDGIMLPTLRVNTSRCSFFSTLLTISVMPNKPIATTMKLIPSVSSGMS